MNRDEFDFITRGLPDDSVKKACYIVQEYTKCDQEGRLYESAVSREEYFKALRIVLAFAHQTSSLHTVASQYHCIDDCEYKNDADFPICPGALEYSPTSKVLCRHYLKPTHEIHSSDD